jgi:MFS superfamily sulfate permease-like transporter
MSELPVAMDMKEMLKTACPFIVLFVLWMFPDILRVLFMPSLIMLAGTVASWMGQKC